MSPSPAPTRTALVTGGSRRLGAALARALAATGRDVAISWREDEAGAEETVAGLRAVGVRASAHRADLSSPVETARLLRDAEAALGPIDLLVLSASPFAGAPLERMDLGDLEVPHEVVVRASYQLLRDLGREWRDRHAADASFEGCAVAILCTSALRAWPTHVGYSAAKAGLRSLVQGFAGLLAPAARVNGIAPGPILPPAGAPPEQGEEAAARTWLGRSGTPDDVAAAMLFLARARYVTGITLAVSGGG